MVTSDESYRCQVFSTSPQIEFCVFYHRSQVKAVFRFNPFRRLGSQNPFSLNRLYLHLLFPFLFDKQVFHLIRFHSCWSPFLWFRQPTRKSFFAARYSSNSVQVSQLFHNVLSLIFNIYTAHHFLSYIFSYITWNTKFHCNKLEIIIIINYDNSCLQNSRLQLLVTEFYRLNVGYNTIVGTAFNHFMYTFFVELRFNILLI